MKDMWKVNEPERAMAFLKSILCNVKPGVLHYVNGLVRTLPILLSNISIHKRWISAYKSIQFCLEYEITQSFTVSSSCCVCAWVCAWVCLSMFAWVCLSMFAWVLQISVNTSLTLISLSFVCSKVMLAKAILLVLSSFVEMTASRESFGIFHQFVQGTERHNFPLSGFPLSP